MLLPTFAFVFSRNLLFCSFEERELFQPGRPLSKRQIALLSPRLGVLNHIPFAIPFDVRVSIFRSFVSNDKMTRGLDRLRGHPATARVTVRREKIAEDGFNALDGYDLRGPIAITFIDQFGQEEYVTTVPQSI